MSVFARCAFVVLFFAGIATSLASYSNGYAAGAKEPTSAERQLAETWKLSAESTDRLIITLDDALRALDDDTCEVGLK